MFAGMCASVRAFALLCVHLQYFAGGYLGVESGGVGGWYELRLSPLRTSTVDVLLSCLGRAQ